jgi:hypothetical protein
MRFTHPSLLELPSDALAEIAEQIAAEPPLHLLPPGAERRWAQVTVTRSYEAWIVAWPPGSGLPMHDHGGAAGALRVVRGRLHEDRMTGDECVSGWLEPGCHSVPLPVESAHAVANADRIEALSIHVYSPPGRPVHLRRTA